MSRLEYDEDGFYLYAMELFTMTGHSTSSVPLFANHSPEQFVYLDNHSYVSLSRDQRLMFGAFRNISKLFAYNECSFYSIILLTATSERSQIAHNIHTMLYPFMDSKGTICLFRCRNEIMLTFIGFGCRCILSDWYPLEDDYNRLLQRLDIANMSIGLSADYFRDMVYSLARSYYLLCQPSTYEIIPIDFIIGSLTERIDKEELNDFITHELSAPEREYGSDFVKYGESANSPEEDIGAELDLMLLEMDEEDDKMFGEDIEFEESEFEADDFFNEDSSEGNQDEYEFSDIDPEIFRDPTLMVKWLNKMDKTEPHHA